jgi:uncharacterized protein with GYD domain
MQMQTYILLVNFTDQGMHNIKDTIGRAHAFEDMAKRAVRFSRSSAGPSAATTSSPCSRRPTTRAALSFSVSSLGSVRTEILRAFSFEEMHGILAKMV